MGGDFESLVFGLLFLAVVVFQVIKQFLAASAEQRRRQRQAQQAKAGGRDTQAQPEPEPLELTGSDWGRAPEPVPAPAHVPLEVKHAPRPHVPPSRDRAPTAARPKATQQQQRLRARHRLFHSQGALRHGIVMMTVLGPCRALQAYDENNP